jgi:hypothetical protein
MRVQTASGALKATPCCGGLAQLHPEAFDRFRAHKRSAEALPPPASTEGQPCPHFVTLGNTIVLFAATVKGKNAFSRGLMWKTTMGYYMEGSARVTPLYIGGRLGDEIDAVGRGLAARGWTWSDCARNGISRQIGGCVIHSFVSPLSRRCLAVEMWWKTARAARRGEYYEVISYSSCSLSTAKRQCASKRRLSKAFR